MTTTPGLGAFPHRRTLGVLIASLLTFSVNAAPLTRDNGAAVGDNQNSQTAGATGPVLLQDVQLIQKLQRFDRERIPERVVHARGTGAHGTFTVTDDLSDLSKAKVFAAGQSTPVFVRFSAVVHGNHSPETLRDPRGFATKFYTEQGNWDLVGNNFPTFFIRDAIKFPDMVHAFKPDPDKNYGTDRTLWDFFQHVPEATRTLTGQAPLRTRRVRPRRLRQCCLHADRARGGQALDRAGQRRRAQHHEEARHAGGLPRGTDRRRGDHMGGLGVGDRERLGHRPGRTRRDTLTRTIDHQRH